MAHSSMDTHTRAALTHVEGTLNYLANTTERPAYYINPDRSTPPTRPAQTKHTVPIYNGRDAVEQLLLDQQGLMLTKHETKVTNFYNPEEVKTVYYPEVEELVKKLTGATKVVAFDHNVRCAPRAKQGETGISSPVLFAHNDYTVKSGPQRVRDILPAEEAKKLLRHRFAVINVWRPIRVPAQDTPLAVCDAQSMEQKDFIATDLKFPDRTGEIYSVAYNPEQRWFYFPRMQPDEAMLLKCYDSMEDGRARFTAHSAFNDPTAPAGAPPRESIETRTFVFFAPEA
jgi:hypothetical protein